MNLMSQYLIFLIFTVVLLITFNYTNVVISTSNGVIDLESEQTWTIRAIPFNNTILSSLTIDPISDLVYVSGMSDSCLKENMNSSNGSGSQLPCSII